MTSDKKKLFLPLFLGFIMIASVFGAVFYGFSDSASKSQTIDYKGQRFSAISGYWKTRISNQEFNFAYNPKQVEPLEINAFPIEEFNSGNKIYVSYDPNENMAKGLLEVQNNLLPFFSRTVIRACPEDVSGCENLPLKTCTDAVDGNKILLIELTNASETEYSNGCYAIRGQDNEIAMTVDRIAFSLLGLTE